jgi:hypothetical protein
MRLRSISLYIFAAALTSCTGDDAGTGTTTSPSSPSGPSAAATATPRANRAPGPVVVDFQPKGTALAGATSVGFGAAVTDPDGDPLTYEWDFGDEVIKTPNGGIGYTFRRGRSTIVRVTVTDGKGGTSVGQTEINVGTLDGSWTVTDAVHEQLTAHISHNGGPSLSGDITNGSQLSGSVSDPYGVRLRIDAPNAYCLLTGTYNGSTDSSLRSIIFPGGGCRGFELHRQ